MELPRIEIEIGNPATDLPLMKATVVHDPSQLYLSLPKNLAEDMGLSLSGTRTLPDSTIVPYVGPVTVKAMGHIGIFGGIIRGREIVIGTLPLTELGLKYDSDGFQFIDIAI